ncbi:MAG TPA: methyltransferase domain-containing protein [Polyangia bacterium]
MRLLSPALPRLVVLASALAVSPVTRAQTPQAQTPETSVRPGANQQYKETELAAWIKRFESGGREIFDNRHAIVEKSGIRSGMQVADVGAGTGLFSLLFAEAVGPTGRVYAVDIIPKFLAHTAARAKKAGFRNLETRLGSERSVELPANSVDVVFLCDAYHHFEYPRSMNASMWKALRPGGTLVLIDFVRIPGKTPAGTLAHVRAGEDVFTSELLAAGFEKVENVPLLTENYFVLFRKPAAKDAPIKR